MYVYRSSVARSTEWWSNCDKDQSDNNTDDQAFLNQSSCDA